MGGCEGVRVLVGSWVGECEWEGVMKCGQEQKDCVGRLHSYTN